VPNDTGRPMYCAKDMLKLYVYGYMNRSRSSRRLEAKTKKASKNVFRDFAKLCLDLGLYGIELITVDGSRFQAVNSKENNFNFDKIKDRIKRINNRINSYMEELDAIDEEENNAQSEASKEKISNIIEGLTARKEKYKETRTEMREAGVKQKSLTDPDSRRMTTAHGGSMMAYNIQSAVDNKHKLVAEFEVTNAGADIAECIMNNMED